MTAAVFFHLCLEKMPLPSYEFVTNPLLGRFDSGVGVVVGVLDDLERPPTVDDVLPDDVPLEVLGEVGVSCVSQDVYYFSESKIRRPRQAMKAVKVAASVLENFERFGDLPTAATVASSTPSGRWWSRSGRSTSMEVMP